MSSKIESDELEDRPARESTPVGSASPPNTQERLVSLDAFRGAVMLLMASSGMGIPQVAKHFSHSAVWAFLGYEFEHPEWAGVSLWDFIQPSFMFMVGVAVPWSVSNRIARGQSFKSMFGHALLRALLLVLLSIFLQSTWSKQTDWSFTNVLAQVGLGYPFLFLLAFAKPRTQWLTAIGILFGFWMLFALYPLPGPGFDWKSVGVPDNWQHLTGFAAHWEKNTNPAAAIDHWLLNLFPRESPFTFQSGGYETLNFIPSLATMVFGLLAGQLLRGDLTVKEKIKRLVIAGITGIVLGKAIELAGLCPIVKRIWTPSWTLFSSGIVVLLLALFVAIIDWRGKKKWAFPLIVAGLNPITLYVMWQIMAGPVRGRIKIHFGQHVFESFGTIYAPMLERISVLIVFWLILYWMYRRHIFIRI
jgi:heparan-alpha-glucosaminide N-acetyltransferase